MTVQLPRALETRIAEIVPLLLPSTERYRTEGPDADNRLWYICGDRRAFCERTSDASVTIRVFTADGVEQRPLAAAAIAPSANALAALIAVALLE